MKSIRRKQMNTAFRRAAGRFRALVNETAAAPGLAAAVRALVKNRDGPSYTVRSPVVFNAALDEAGVDAGITLILAGDNPGRREQESGRYLVGPSGKIAEAFFCQRPELGVDFRKNVLILNKTPVHTPRTAELKTLCRPGSAYTAAVTASQKVMAELLSEFWTALRPASGILPVWITGYSEMKKGGVFAAYTERLRELCAADGAFRRSVFLYRHFSMNQFTIDLKRQTRPGETTAEALARIGAAYRERVLGGQGFTAIPC